MTVKQLKELLADAPDDMEVFVQKESTLGVFVFAPACHQSSGVADFGPPIEEGYRQPEKGFVVMSHDSGVTEDEMDEHKPDNLN